MIVDLQRACARVTVSVAMLAATHFVYKSHGVLYSVFKVFVVWL